MKKIIIYNFNRIKGLDKPICKEMPEVKKIKFTDREIGGVAYRVWSAFTDEINAADSRTNITCVINELYATGAINERVERIKDNHRNATLIFSPKRL